MARVLCAEIGRSLIKICEMDYKVKNPKVYFLTETETPKDSINDGYLSLEGMEKLQEVIKNVLSSNHIKTKKIVFTVVSGKIINREVTLPAVKLQMIPDMIQTNMTEYFPVDLSEYETTHSVLETYKEGPEAGKHRVIISAMENIMVQQYKTLAESCGLVLANLYYSGDSVFQALKEESDEDTWAVVKVEENHSVITVLKKGHLMLQRNIPYGVGEAIELILNQEDNKLDSYLEVWRLCSRENMRRIEEYDEILKAIVSGVARIIDFYNSRHREDEIVRVSLAGMGAEIMGFRELFRDELNMPCHQLTRINRAVLHTSTTEKTVGTFVACVGAGLAKEGFYHEEKNGVNNAEVNYGRLSVLIILFFLVLSGGLSLMAYFTYAEQKQEKSLLEQQKIMYEPGVAAYEQFENVSALLNDLRYGEMLTRHRNEELLYFLQELENTMPEDVEFKEFGSDETTVVMTMVVTDKEKAAKVIETLRGFKSLMQVNVNSFIEKEKKAATSGNGNSSRTGSNSQDYVVLEKVIEFTVEGTYLPMDSMKDDAVNAE